MNIIKVKTVTPRIEDLKVGEVAKIVRFNASTGLILRTKDHYVDLGDNEVLWSGKETPKFVSMEILPPGTKLEITL